ncbi:MAG: LMBR1 domain-containing protein [Calditrichaeota bacterium]|nr:LMBR1 domain-containing protein [Calditrichota bacterium]
MEKEFGIIGSLASVVGLGLSVWIIFNTDKLKKALSDARQSLLKRFEREETLDDVSSLIHKIEQMETYAISEKWDIVVYLIDDLLRTYPLVLQKELVREDKDVIASHLSLNRIRRELQKAQPKGDKIKNRLHEAIISLRKNEAVLKLRKEEHYVQ